jgi:hypothetical protein
MQNWSDRRGCASASRDENVHLARGLDAPNKQCLDPVGLGHTDLH